MCSYASLVIVTVLNVFTVSKLNQDYLRALHTKTTAVMLNVHIVRSFIGA